MSKDVKYSLELNMFLKYSNWGLPILSIIIFIVYLKFSEINNLKILVFLPFFVFGFWNWAKYLNRPVKIDVYEDSATLFNIFKRETKIKFSEINSIESDRTKALVIRTESKMIRGVNGFADFSKFIKDVKIVNQKIIITGL